MWAMMIFVSFLKDGYPNGYKVYPPRLRDLYDLGNKKSGAKFYNFGL